MTEFHRYIAEEIAIDHAEGVLPRREAMRRLGLLGLSAGAASALIAACGGGGKKGSTGATTGTQAITSPPPGMDHALPTQPVTWQGPTVQLQGAWAPAQNVRGGVLVIHENTGLNEWVKSVAGRFAGAGYSALAIDLLSEQGGTAKVGDAGQAQAAISKIPSEQAVADLKSGVGELQRRVPDKKLAVVGFCWGGGMVWKLLASGEPRLAAAVPFYGPLPDNPDFSGSKGVAVLPIYGALDNHVTPSKDAAIAALDRAGLVHAPPLVEPDANHAFFNDTKQSYNPAAAADAWRHVLAWLGQYLG